MARTQKHLLADKLPRPDESRLSLSPEERSVLEVFRNYLMTPGKMLCLSGPKLDASEAPLAELTGKGLLVAESFRGGYSLTENGFEAMKDVE